MTRFGFSAKAEDRLREGHPGDAIPDELQMVRRFPDPYAVFSDTPFRFALLVVAVISTSLFAFQALFLTTHEAEFARARRDCAPADLADARTASLCRQGFERSEARWMLLGVGALLVVSILLMIAAPWWRTRRGRFYPVDPRDDPELSRELDALRARAGGLDVAFMLDPFDPRTSALAYGRPRQRRVLLRAGLVTKRYSEPETFRAVVLHELAHIRNADVDQAYLSLCTCTAFLLVAVVPVAVVLGGSFLWLPVLWRLMCLTALVYLLLLGLLRSRELHADARAAQWGVAPALLQVLDVTRSTGRPRLRRLLSLHPLPADRVEALRDPRALFQLTALDGLGVGLVAALAAPQATFLMDLITTRPNASVIWGFIPFAVLAAGFLVTGIWRQQYYGVYRYPAGRTWPLTAGFATGLAIGPTLAFIEIVSLRPTGVNGVAWHVSLTVLVCLVTIPLGSWMVEGARSACSGGPSHVGPERQPVLRRGIVVSVLLGAVVLDGLFYQSKRLRDLAVPSDATFADAVRVPFTTARELWTPLLWSTSTHVLVLLCVLALPLVGWVLFRPPARGLFRFSVSAGALAGLGLAGFVAITNVLALQRPLVRRWPLAFGQVLELGWRAVAVVACVAAGIVAANHVRRLPLAAAGVAALSAGVAGFAVLIVLSPLRSCLPSVSAIPTTADQCPSLSSASYARQALWHVLAGGLAWTVLVVPVAVALATWYGRRRVLGARRVLARRRVVGSAIAVLVSMVALVAAVRSVDAAERSSSQIQGSIGRDGQVLGLGYAVSLRPGWLETTSQQPVTPGELPLDLVVDLNDGQGRLMVRLMVYVNQAKGYGVAWAAGQAQLKPSEAGRIDGERAVEIVSPARPAQLQRELFVEHQGITFVLRLWVKPEARQFAHSHFEWMLDHWSWT